MKVCLKCQKEFDDKLTFCPFCGAENGDKKLTYFEKKEAREHDREVMISKASIQDEDVESAKPISADVLTVQKINSIKKAEMIAIIKSAISLIILIALLVTAFIISKLDVNDNIKLAVILGAFILVAACASVIISEGYAFVAIKKLKGQDFSFRKIFYQKGPVFSFKDDLFEVGSDANCKECDNKTHVEIKDEDLFVVCNVDRAHLFKIDRDECIAILKEKIEQK